jgi:hypothetical protein
MAARITVRFLASRLKTRLIDAVCDISAMSYARILRVSPST